MPGRRRVHGNEYQLRRYGNMYGGSQGFPQEIRNEEQGLRRYREQQATYGSRPQQGYEEELDYGPEDEFEEEASGNSDDSQGEARNSSPPLHGSGYGSRSRRRSMPEDYQGAYGQSGQQRQSQAGSSQPGSQGGFRGRGPKGYRRSDERITDEVNDLLTDHDELDASDIEISVKDGEVTLTGMVSDRRAKRLAEDLADDVSGVQEVHNQLRINRAQDLGASKGDSAGQANENKGKK